MPKSRRMTIFFLHKRAQYSNTLSRLYGPEQRKNKKPEKSWKKKKVERIFIMTDDEYFTNSLTPNKIEFKPSKSLDTSFSSDSKGNYPESMSNIEVVDAVVRLNENDVTKIRLQSSNVSYTLTLSIKMVCMYSRVLKSHWSGRLST